MKTGIKLPDGWMKSSHSGHAGACVIARKKGDALEFGDSKFGRMYSGPTPVLSVGAEEIASLKKAFNAS